MIAKPATVSKIYDISIVKSLLFLVNYDYLENNKIFIESIPNPYIK